MVHPPPENAISGVEPGGSNETTGIELNGPFVCLEDFFRLHTVPLAVVMLATGSTTAAALSALEVRLPSEQPSLAILPQQVSLGRQPAGGREQSHPPRSEFGHLGQ